MKFYPNETSQPQQMLTQIQPQGQPIAQATPPPSGQSNQQAGQTG